MFPPPLIQNLHLINQTKRTTLRPLCLLRPLAHSAAHDPVIPDRGTDPAQDPTFPNRNIDADRRHDSIGRVHSIVRRTVVSDFDVWIEENAFLRRVRVVSVNQAAFARFDVRGGEGVGDASEAEGRGGEERRDWHSDCSLSVHDSHVHARATSGSGTYPCRSNSSLQEPVGTAQLHISTCRPGTTATFP